MLRERFSKEWLGKKITFCDVYEREYSARLIEWLEDGTLVLEDMLSNDLDIVGYDSRHIQERPGMTFFNGSHIKCFYFEMF